MLSFYNVHSATLTGNMNYIDKTNHKTLKDNVYYIILNKIFFFYL